MNSQPFGPYPAHLAPRPRGARRASRSTGARRPRASAGRSSAPSSRPADRNVIGAHGGSYALYRALAVSSGALDPIRRPDLTNTHPGRDDRPVPAMVASRARSSRSIPGAIWSRRISARRSPRASTSARRIADHQGAARPARDPRRDRGRPAQGRRRRSCTRTASVSVTKIAIDPVWYLPGIAERFGVTRDEPAPHACSSRPAACFPSW